MADQMILVFERSRLFDVPFFSSQLLTPATTVHFFHHAAMCYQQVFAPLLVGGYYTCSWAPTDEHGDLLVIQGLNGGSSKAAA